MLQQVACIHALTSLEVALNWGSTALFMVIECTMAAEHSHQCLVQCNICNQQTHMQGLHHPAHTTAAFADAKTDRLQNSNHQQIPQQCLVCPVHSRQSAIWLEPRAASRSRGSHYDADGVHFLFLLAWLGNVGCAYLFIALDKTLCFLAQLHSSLAIDCPLSQGIKADVSQISPHLQ